VRAGIGRTPRRELVKFNDVGIPNVDSFEGEMALPHLRMTVSDHLNNPFGIQWQPYWEGAPYPDLVKTVPHVLTYNAMRAESYQLPACSPVNRATPRC
jgi:hypothetical protein